MTDVERLEMIRVNLAMYDKPPLSLFVNMPKTREHIKRLRQEEKRLRTKISHAH